MHPLSFNYLSFWKLMQAFLFYFPTLSFAHQYVNIIHWRAKLCTLLQVFTSCLKLHVSSSEKVIKDGQIGVMARNTNDSKIKFSFDYYLFISLVFKPFLHVALTNAYEVSK